MVFRSPLLALVLAASVCEARVLPLVEGIVPDGDLADWGEAGLGVPFLAPDSPVPPDATRSRASARLAWDPEGLLVAVEVWDDTPSEAHRASGAYLADSVELFLAPDPAKWESLQLVLSPGRDPAHPEPRAYVFDNRPEPLQALPAQVAWAVRARAGGYIAEARLPWAALGIEARAGGTVATRLFVNDHDGGDARTRFGWQPARGGGRFFKLLLGESGGLGTKPEPQSWLALDATETGVRLNIVGPGELAGTEWHVRGGDDMLGGFTLAANGPLAAGGMLLPPAITAADAARPLRVTGPDGTTVELDDTRAGLAAGAVTRANGGWRGGYSERAALAFARFEFAQYIFVGDGFPRPAFVGEAGVARLLGAAPETRTRWLDASGADVAAPTGAGLYAARTEIVLPGRAKPFVRENMVYRMPDGATVPPDHDEAAAIRLGFALMGADATSSHAARVAERWWHGVRRARGWANALPYELRVPEGAADGRARPLIVHLHGSGQSRPEDARRVLAELAELAGPEPIIAYPMSPESWRGPAVGEMIDAIARAHAVDPARVYLIGFSMGGIGSWEVALDQPGRFAAVVPIGGRMGSPSDAARLRVTPVWVFNGEDDPTTTTEEAMLMVEALRRAGGEPRLTLLRGKSHGDSQAAAYRHPGLFEWMLARRLTPGPGSEDARRDSRP